MNQILELRRTRAKIWNDAKKFLDEHRSDDGHLSEEDEKVYEKMEADVVRLGIEIERLEKQARIDAEVNCPMNETIYDENEKRNTISGALQEANKILNEIDCILSEMEAFILGNVNNDDGTRKSAQNLHEEAMFITALSYNCLQKLSRIKEGLI